MVYVVEEPSGAESLRLDLDRAMLEFSVRPTPENRMAIRRCEDALETLASKRGQETAGSWRGFGAF